MLSFSVKNLGKIDEAHFSDAALTLLIGQNNTGKSYLASLIWALGRAELFIDGDTSKPEWFVEFEKRFEGNAEVRHKVGSEHALQCIDYLQRSFKNGGVLNRLFSHEGFSATELNLELSDDFEPFEISFAQSAAEPNGVQSGLVEFSQGNQKIRRMRFPLGRRFRRLFIRNRILTDSIGLSLFGPLWSNYRNPIYIPAARTGLMLALRSLIARTLESEDDRPVNLPLPITDFLSTLVATSPSFGGEGGHHTAAWLETKVLHGTLDVSDDEVPSFAYIPEATVAKLPLHATSSMITEMAPFIHLVRTSNPLTHYIFEEPEAHLHLSAQRDMARAIARLLNKGARFTITTHSDTFVQQINNLMRLHRHTGNAERLAEFGYDESDLIDPRLANAFEFVTTADQGTAIRPVKKTEHGFVVPSLNDTLISLSNETIELADDEND